MKAHTFEVTLLALDKSASDNLPSMATVLVSAVSRTEARRAALHRAVNPDSVVYWENGTPDLNNVRTGRVVDLGEDEGS